jgi:hypothetical protein
LRKSLFPFEETGFFIFTKIIWRKDMRNQELFEEVRDADIEEVILTYVGGGCHYFSATLTAISPA